MTNYKKYQQSDSITISIEETCIADNGIEVARHVAVKTDHEYIGYVHRHWHFQTTWEAVFSIEDKTLHSGFIYESEHDAIKALVALSNWEWKYF